MSMLPTGPLPHDAKQKSPVQEHQQESADIHNIMERYQRDGFIQHVNQNKARYEEMPNSIDFHTAQNIIAEAKSAFESVPAEIRAEFDNDPGKYFEFMNNPDNYQEIQKMGVNPDWLPEPVQTPSEPTVEEIVTSPTPTPTT